MALLLDLATYLQTQGLGTLATSLFIGTIPQDATGVPDALSALFPPPGLPPLAVHDSPAAAIARPTVQVITRGAPYGYSAAQSRAMQALLALHDVRNQTLSGTRYLHIEALQSEPLLLRTDERSRPLLAFTVLCHKEF